MSVIVTGVERHSHAELEGIHPEDILVSINGNNINDVLDYMFYSTESKLDIKLIRASNELEISVIKSEYDDLGLKFETFLMDNKKSCHNKCIFCFIDQMPIGMRETLYFKDDDARLSFLHGNYVTLTNLTQNDINRIIKMKLNINVSVHTTNPELRCKMMNNRFAGKKIDYLYQLANAGIRLNCQIVLCPGINDGKELERTLIDLGNIMPNIQSIAVVPVGLSKYREGLFPLKPFDKNTASDAIAVIELYQKMFLEKFGTRLVFPADEFFLKAEKSIPFEEFYEEYPQYENGVGMLRSLENEFFDALDVYKDYVCEDRNITVATGIAAFSFIKNLVEKALEKWQNLKCNTIPIINEFFGENITVSGLITGKDLIEQLKSKDLGDILLIPSSMIRKDDDIFLDDITVPDVEKELSIKVIAVENDGYLLLEKILGIEK